MKKILIVIFISSLLISGCAEQISDPTRQKEAHKAKKVRQENTRSFSGNY